MSLDKKGYIFSGVDTYMVILSRNQKFLEVVDILNTHGVGCLGSKTVGLYIVDKRLLEGFYT